MNISKWQIFCLLATIFPEAVIEYLVTPLLPFMVRSFAASNSAAGAGAAASDKNVGYLTGLLGSSFYAPLLVTNAMWGGLSDHIGRKPVLVLGLIFGGLSTFVLGLSRTFWLAFLCRFVAGIFGANSTVVKGRLGECSDEVQRAWGYSMYGALFGLGEIALLIFERCPFL